MMFLFFGCVDQAPPPGEPITKIVEIEKCSTLYGHKICDFDAINENGSDVFLSDLYGKPIVLDIAAMWCGPCQIAGRDMQNAANEIPEVTFLTVIIEDGQGNTPEPNDLAGWKNSLGITDCEVWGSSRDIVTANPIELEDKLYMDALPTFYFINSDGSLEKYVRGYNEEMVKDIARSLE